MLSSVKCISSKLSTKPTMGFFKRYCTDNIKLINDRLHFPGEIADRAVGNKVY